MHQKALQYIGIKYTWWNEGDQIGLDVPFYVTDKVPSMSEIKAKGINCAGLFNLAYVETGHKIPEIKYKGGTFAWFEYYRHKLQMINSETQFQSDDILFREYKNPEDQGHIAIVINSFCVIHAIPGEGVVITSINKVRTYMTHILYSLDL